MEGGFTHSGRADIIRLAPSERIAMHGGLTLSEETDEGKSL